MQQRVGVNATAVNSLMPISYSNGSGSGSGSGSVRASKAVGVRWFIEQFRLIECDACSLTVAFLIVFVVGLNTFIYLNRDALSRAANQTYDFNTPPAAAVVAPAPPHTHTAPPPHDSALSHSAVWTDPQLPVAPAAGAGAVSPAAAGAVPAVDTHPLSLRHVWERHTHKLSEAAAAAAAAAAVAASKPVVPPAAPPPAVSRGRFRARLNTLKPATGDASGPPGASKVGRRLRTTP